MEILRLWTVVQFVHFHGAYRALAMPYPGVAGESIDAVQKGTPHCPTPNSRPNYLDRNACCAVRPYAHIPQNLAYGAFPLVGGVSLWEVAVNPMVENRPARFRYEFSGFSG